MLPSPHESKRSPRRRRVLGGLTVAALLVHASLLGGTGQADIGRTDEPTRVSTLDVRVIEAAPGDLPTTSASPPAPESEAKTLPATMPPTNPVTRPRVVVPREAIASRRVAAAPTFAQVRPALSESVRDDSSTSSTSSSSSSSLATASSDASLSGSTASTLTASMLPVALVVASAVDIQGAANAGAGGVAHDAGTGSTPPGAGASAAPTALAADAALPVYRTLMPPATTLRYQVRRGFLRGTGEIHWQPAADAYRLRLEARVAGLVLLTQTSEGAFDRAGIAPVRYTDQRARRAPSAANFQHATHKITFSGPAVELPLERGAQDRLSWMIQLAAVLAAQPELLVPGGSVAMSVVGARGDAAVWVFRYVGVETVDGADGPVRAAKLVRESGGPYDTTVEVWVDPARHYLPVHAKQVSGGGDEFDLLLEAMSPG